MNAKSSLNSSWARWSYQYSRNWRDKTSAAYFSCATMFSCVFNNKINQMFSID